MTAQNPDGPFVQVSLKDLLLEIREGNKQTAEALHQVQLLGRDIIELKKDVTKLEIDVEALKKSRWPIPGAAVLISALSLLYILFKDSIKGV